MGLGAGVLPFSFTITNQSLSLAEESVLVSTKRDCRKRQEEPSGINDIQDTSMVQLMRSSANKHAICLLVSYTLLPSYYNQL